MKKLFFFAGALFLLAGVSASGLDSSEGEFLSLINQYRNQATECYDSQNGWGAWPSGSSRNLTEAPSLSTASLGHNQTMISMNCFEHLCPGEAAFDQRANGAGYTGWGFLAENIAMGYATAQEALTGWQNSSGHNQNMLSCKARAIGISRTDGGSTSPHWTTMFGDVVQLGGTTAPPPVAPPQPPPAPAPTPPPVAPPSGSGLAQYDLDQNCFFGNTEFFLALDDWIADSLDNSTFFQVVDAWIQNSSFC
jgi:uncharacterized protein YkwD